MQNQRLVSLADALRPAVLTALTAGIAVFAARLVHAGIGGLWVVITAVVVLQSTTAESLQASGERLTIVGACAGGIVGAGLGVSPVAVAGAVLIAALVCTIPALKRSVRLACLTAVIVVLIPGSSSIISALNRFADTVPGILVALTVTVMVVLIDRFGARAALERR